MKKLRFPEFSENTNVIFNSIESNKEYFIGIDNYLNIVRNEMQILSADCFNKHDNAVMGNKLLQHINIIDRRVGII